MSIQNMINELTSRRSVIEQGNEEAVKKLHADSKLTARERIEELLDTNSFVEIGAFVQHRATDFNLSVKDTPADGVVTGYGTIDGKLVYVYSQDVTVLGGALGEMHAKKICAVYDMAMKMGAPIIALLDSTGVRLQESTDALNGFGQIFLKQTLASGVIPQITAILGTCGGGATIIPSLSDFTFMTKKATNLFVNSPNSLDSKSETLETIASADFHSKETGIVDFVCQDETSLLSEVRNFVNLLPSNNFEESPIFDTNDDLNRASSELNDIVTEDISAGIDMKVVISQVADNNLFVETKANHAESLITGLIRLNGQTVGVVANQSVDNDALLTSIACNKGAKFVNFCDSFNIPVLTFTDVAGYSATVAEEKSGISKAVSKLLCAFAGATVPKVNVVVGRGFGTAYVAMNSKHIGADFVYAWPNSKVAMMNSDSAVKIMYADELDNSKISTKEINNKTAEYEELQASPYAAASRGYIDDIIEPAATRKRVIVALEMLYSKRESRPEKKHVTV
ncbi:methylmalonyl-CoA carboxyltransferase [Vallitalea longa]|uniref:Methylmalonyl-CoA carboxyltransferase n=1 Tax=Vallitalea longa TaxID=2936439 RepID=A0A9W5YBN6_9FIRM|nr:acyl-CoA carboxylase subunit beta [Vallitalea longa]GKX30149.1 methylmalonyl-CoA carboxyltransferase [Vallitalea longa]